MFTNIDSSAREFSGKSFGIDVSGAIAQTCRKKIFDSPVYFVERCMPSNHNAHNNRAQGMGPHVRMFFQGGTKNGKKESQEEGNKEKSDEEKSQEEKIGL